MPYSATLGRTTPGSIILLLDQSLSMNEPFGEAGTRKNTAATVINSTIEKIIASSMKDDEISPRAFISVIGYGNENNVEVLLNGMVDDIQKKILRIEKKEKKVFNGIDGMEIVNVDLPIWIEPLAHGATPMKEVFIEAKKIAEERCIDFPKSYPPIIINITDGYPYPDTDKQIEEIKKISKEIRSLSTIDGNTLIFNAHISGNSTTPIILPDSTDSFNDDIYAKFLFDISSDIPIELLDGAKKMNNNISENSKCVIYNGNIENMIDLLEFGTEVLIDGV